MLNEKQLKGLKQSYDDYIWTSVINFRLKEFLKFNKIPSNEKIEEFKKTLLSFEEFINFKTFCNN